MIRKSQNGLMVSMIVKSITDEAHYRLCRGQDVNAVEKQAAGALGQLVKKANEAGFNISDWTEETMWSQVNGLFELYRHESYSILSLVDKKSRGA